MSDEKRSERKTITEPCRCCGQPREVCALCRGSGYVSESKSTDLGNGYGSFSMTQKRCPQGCPAPIMRLASVAAPSTWGSGVTPE